MSEQSFLLGSGRAVVGAIMRMVIVRVSDWWNLASIGD